MNHQGDFRVDGSVHSNVERIHIQIYLHASVLLLTFTGSIENSSLESSTAYGIVFQMLIRPVLTVHALFGRFFQITVYQFD
jgi:hypothetical protein